MSPRVVNLSIRGLSLSWMFLMTDNKWARLLAYVTGLVNQKLLLQNEYLAAENRILRAHLPVADGSRDSDGSRIGGNARRREGDVLPGRSERRGVGREG